MMISSNSDFAIELLKAVGIKDTDEISEATIHMKAGELIMVTMTRYATPLRIEGDALVEIREKFIVGAERVEE